MGSEPYLKEISGLTTISMAIQRISDYLGLVGVPPERIAVLDLDA